MCVCVCVCVCVSLSLSLSLSLKNKSGTGYRFVFQAFDADFIRLEYNGILVPVRTSFGLCSDEGLTLETSANTLFTAFINLIDTLYVLFAWPHHFTLYNPYTPECLTVPCLTNLCSSVQLV